MTRATSFKKIVLCHTNDFKPNVNDKIAKWVEAHGGIFSKSLTPDVTHLVASNKAWKRYVGIGGAIELLPPRLVTDRHQVQQARRMRTVYIVNFDWLEDSLLKKPVRALHEEKYLFEPTSYSRIKKARKKVVTDDAEANVHGDRRMSVPRDKRIETAGVEFQRAQQEFEQDMGIAGFHPYADSCGFFYIITLLRYDIFKKHFEKYRLKVGHDLSSRSHEELHGMQNWPHPTPVTYPFLANTVLGYRILPHIKTASCVHIAEPWIQCIQLYESNRKPHAYACYTQYTRPGVTKQIRVLAPPGSTWEFAWTMFEKFFKTKVYSKWDERASVGTEIRLEGGLDERAFQYQAPRPGEPEGLRPDQSVSCDLVMESASDQKTQRAALDPVNMHEPTLKGHSAVDKGNEPVHFDGEHRARETKDIKSEH